MPQRNKVNNLGKEFFNTEYAEIAQLVEHTLPPRNKVNNLGKEFFNIEYAEIAQLVEHNLAAKK